MIPRTQSRRKGSGIAPQLPFEVFQSISRTCFRCHRRSFFLTTVPAAKAVLEGADGRPGGLAW